MTFLSYILLKIHTYPSPLNEGMAGLQMIIYTPPMLMNFINETSCKTKTNQYFTTVQQQQRQINTSVPYNNNYIFIKLKRKMHRNNLVGQGTLHQTLWQCQGHCNHGTNFFTTCLVIASKATTVFQLNVTLCLKCNS